MCPKLNNLLSLILIVTLFSCTSKKESGKELRLISWNCANFLLSLDTLHAASAFLNAQNPDIICLQERPHTNLVRYDSIKKCFPSLPYKVTNGREDENLNVSIFSKFPISNVKTWYFTDTYNKMIQADINRDGETFRLFNVHLQTTSSGGTFDNCIRRYRQSRLLLSEIKKSPYPVIVCGDFNDIQLSYTIQNLLTNLEDISLSYRSSYQKLGNLFKIDYILASSQWEKVHYELIPTKWSDHKIQNSILSYNE